MCSGHGKCVRGTHCKCDHGYSGSNCSVADVQNPDFLKEDFEDDTSESKNFKLVSGGKPSRKCGIMASGNHMFFNEDGLRMLETIDMDLSNARFVQFFLRLGCGKASPDPRSQPVLLQFSVNGGISWNLLQKFFYTNSSNQAELVALEIPLQARTTEARLRWWQPSENGYVHSPWVIDKVVVGGSASSWGPLEDNFSTIDERLWILHPGGTRMPVCGSDGNAFAFIEKSNTRYAVTTDISVGQDALIQFDFSASCSVTSSCYSVELEYSLDLGLTWKPLLRDCLPTNPDCSSYTLQRILVSDTYNKWGRVTLPIPAYARCDPEWAGGFCDEAILPLLSQNNGVRKDKRRWNVSDVCSPNLELLTIKCHPFYLPQEFSSIVITIYIPPQADTDTALWELHEAVNLHQTQHHDAVLIVAGDFNSANLKHAASNFHQHITCPTRGSRTLDHCYTQFKDCYKAQSHPPFGKSDHATIFLMPRYKQRLKQEDLVKWEKLWVDKTIHDGLRTRSTAYNSGLASGNMEEYKVASYSLRREAKRCYGKKLESQFHKSDSRSLWQGLRTIMDYRTPSSRMVTAESSLAEKLYTFYACFEAEAHSANSISSAKNAIGSKHTENARKEKAFIISEHNVRKAFRRVNTRKAAGPDGITGWVLKTCADQLAPVFTEIFNLSLEQSMIPILQAVRVGKHVSPSLTLSTGALQGCVLSPLLYSLYIYDCVATSSSTNIKFVNDTAVVGLISNNDKTAYLEDIKNLETRCQDNNLLLNISKTKELIVDFSTKQERNYQPLIINGTPVERVDSFQYLGVQNTQDLSWSCPINTLVKKFRQHLYHLRRLKDFKLPSKVLKTFYTCTTEIILTGSITAWFGNSNKQDRQALQRVVRSVEHTIRTELPDLETIYSKRFWTKARKIMKDLSLPNNVLFSLLRLVAMCQRDTLNNISMSNIQLTLVSPGSIWCHNAFHLTLTVGDKCPSLLSSFLQKAGKELFIPCLTALQTPTDIRRCRGLKAWSSQQAKVTEFFEYIIMQYVDFTMRGTNTLDLVYTNIPGTYRTEPRRHLGYSEHISVMLIPAYRPLVRHSKPVLKQVKTWPAGAISALQDCFECTDWNMFREAATNGDSINLENYTTSVTSYNGKCIDDVTVSKTITTRSNQKPWMTAEDALNDFYTWFEAQNNVAARKTIPPPNDQLGGPAPECIDQLPCFYTVGLGCNASLLHLPQQWALDNILIGGSEINPSVLLDNFDEDLDQGITELLDRLRCNLVVSDEPKHNVPEVFYWI
ncbi:hypothetical protein QTP86_005863 [Hemibagrus guttatus]|nr:hypothetical protein QTP86_005863 [Hemibagrus guttatus]